MSVWRRIKQIARIAASAVAIAAMPQAAAAAEFSLTSGIPANFDDLSGPRDIVVDVYFGGRPLGEARAIIRPASSVFAILLASLLCWPAMATLHASLRC
jgi:hypothetical protein